MSIFDTSISSVQPGSVASSRASDWAPGMSTYGTAGVSNGVHLDQFKLPDLIPIQLDPTLPSLAVNPNWGWSSWVNSDGVVANVDIMTFLNNAKSNVSSLSPSLGYPKQTAQNSHITYDPYLGQATFTFKSGDNPGIAAQDIADSYPSVPVIPKAILHRAVMLELDAQSNGKMKNEHDARHIDIGTTLNVNNILVRASLLYETLGFDKSMADLVNPYPGQDPIATQKKPVDKGDPEKTEAPKPSTTPQKPEAPKPGKEKKE
jgi:hypothetical protein